MHFLNLVHVFHTGCVKVALCHIHRGIGLKETMNNSCNTNEKLIHYGLVFTKKKGIVLYEFFNFLQYRFTFRDTKIMPKQRTNKHLRILASCSPFFAIVTSTPLHSHPNTFSHLSFNQIIQKSMCPYQNVN